MLCGYWLRPLGCTFSHLLARTGLGPVSLLHGIDREPTFTAFYQLHHTQSLFHTHSRFLRLCCFNAFKPPPPLLLHLTHCSTSQPGKKQLIWSEADNGRTCKVMQQSGLWFFLKWHCSFKLRAVWILTGFSNVLTINGTVKYVFSFWCLTWLPYARHRSFQEHTEYWE